jgi:hypothetical protein
MTRLAWCGAESGTVRGDYDEIKVQTASPSVDATVARSGAYSYKSTGASQAMRAAWTPVDARWFYARVWYRFDGLPTGAIHIMQWYGNGNSTVLGPQVDVLPSGQISFQGPTSPTLSAPVSPNTWFCVEFALRGRIGIGYDMIFRLDGITLATASKSAVLTVSNLPDAVQFGYLSNLSSPMNTLWFDDIAVNDDTGSVQNGFPGADGKIIHLLPVADSAVGADWKGNTLLAFSPGAYDCLDNRPPLNNSFGSGGAQVQTRDNIANATSPAADLDVTTAAYSSVLGAGDAVRVCQHRVWVGDGNATLQSQIAVRTLSNPAEAAETTYTTPAVAVATGNLNNTWASGQGPLTYNPTVNKANGAVLRIGKRTAAVDSVGCCYAALQVEYGPDTNAQRFLAVA